MPARHSVTEEEKPEREGRVLPTNTKLPSLKPHPLFLPLAGGRDRFFCNKYIVSLALVIPAVGLLALKFCPASGNLFMPTHRERSQR